MGVVFVVSASIIAAALIVSCGFQPTVLYNSLGIAGVLIGIYGYCLDRKTE